MARSLKLAVDERTGEMSDQALMCRSLGHSWQLRAMSRTRFSELIKLGLTENFRYCANGCGSTWRQVWDVSTGEVVEQEREYPKGLEYKMPHGQGRLHRTKARVAAFARQYPGIA